MIWLLVGCATPPDRLPAGNAGSATLEQLGVVTCLDPAARDAAPFEIVELPGEVVASEPPEGGQYDGGGMAVGDFDGDGLLDLYLPNTGPDQLYLGSGAGFVSADDRLPDAGRAADRSTGAATADVDGDGDLDLFIADQGGDQQIWLNQDGVFSFDESGVAGGGWDGVGGTFADFDGDGDVDLFAYAHYEGHELSDGMVAGKMPPGHPDALYRNRGDGTFEDVSSLLPLALRGDSYTLAAGWYPDASVGAFTLFVVNDFGPFSVPNMALRWNGESLDDVSDEIGFNLAIYGMGLGVGDLNDDGTPDFAMTSWDQLALQLSSPSGWFDAALARGFTPLGDDRHVAWGVVLADLDNDGDLDAPVSFGTLQMPDEIRTQLEDELGLHNPLVQRDALYVQGGDGVFTEEAEAWGVADGGTERGVLAVDIDRDGWLDLIKRDALGPTKVYHARCGAEAWLEVGFAGEGVAARVDVNADGRNQFRWISAGGEGFASGGPPEAHFGLATANTVSLEVVWPDGSHDEFFDIPTRQRVIVSR